MEARFIVPGPLDVVGTLSRLHVWGEDPVIGLGHGRRGRPTRPAAAQPAAAQPAGAQPEVEGRA